MFSVNWVLYICIWPAKDQVPAGCTDRQSMKIKLYWQLHLARSYCGVTFITAWVMLVRIIVGWCQIVHALP